MPSPAHASYWFVQGRILFSVIPLLGIGLFVYILGKRLLPLLEAAPDSRLDRPWMRVARIGQFWLGQ